GGRNKIQCFNVTDLWNNRIIFGYPWLWTFNPTIDWQKGVKGLTIIPTTNQDIPEWMAIYHTIVKGKGVATTTNEDKIYIA
ncbi:hypothetical protein BJV74DRAFT_780065, partial [Russula compacta]